MGYIDSFYLALPPAPAAIPAIERIRDAVRDVHRLRAKPRPKECLHISLHSLGVYHDIPATTIAGACEVAARVAAMISPFPISFERVISFTGRSDGMCPLVLCESGDNPALQELFRLLGSTLKQHSLVRCAPSCFMPHITLLYDRTPVPEYGIPPIRWQVGEFALVHSYVGESRHESLGKWKLRGHRSFN